MVISKEAQAVLKAQTAAALVEVLARALWEKDNPGKDCPPDRIPTTETLAAWLPEFPEAAHLEAGERLAVLYGLSDGGGCRWRLGRTAKLKPRGEWSLTLLAWERPSPGRPGWGSMGKLEEVHEVWLALPAEHRPKHPLAPLVTAWQERPRGVTPDVMQHPHGGILPTPLAGAAVRVQVSDRFDERLPELPGPGVAADGDGWLPLSDPGPGPLAKLPALDFLHAGGLEAFQRGRGAPWPLRIAYETLIDVPAAARNGGIARLEYPLRGDGNATLEAMLYPEGRLNLSRDWGRFLAALKVVDRFAVPADGGMSAWLPIRVRSFPVRTGGVLRLDVSLPPGSDKGPRILRRVLRRLGARSYPQWRAWLALAYLWDRSAVNGHWVRATRPRLARNSGGRLVDRTGTVILDRRGAPVTKWKDKRAVLLDAEGRPVPTAGEAARERNPEASLHPWLTAADIMALGYPPERGLSASALSMRKARVLEDLAAFEAEGLIVFEAHPDGRRWRVLPPDTDPV